MNRDDFIAALAAMEINDPPLITDFVRTTPAFHQAIRRQVESGKLADMVFKAFAYKRRIYVVRVK